MNALEVRNLRFRYGSPETPWTVDVPSLTLAPGEQMLLTAPSGRGKSTLLHLIAGLTDPQEGSVAVDGQNIHALKAAARDLFRGRTIGMIFQTFNLLHGFSAAENVMAALLFSGRPAREHRPRADELLAELGIEEPDKAIDRFSVGQQQRVAVARAVACAPKLVLADEPTASLDPENAATAIDLIQRACAKAGAALLCVSHDPSMTGKFANRVRLEGAPSR